MRLRWTLTLAFVALAVLQVAVVVPLSLRNVNALLSRQQESRIALVMDAVEAEGRRLSDTLNRTMDELAQSPALEDVARDAAAVPAPPHVTTAATTLMTPRGLDVLALLDDTGRTLSSGHLPARLGEPDDPLFAVTRQEGRRLNAVLVELPGPAGLTKAPALVTARPVDYGERRVWIVGGVLVGEARAKELARLTGARIEVRTPDALVGEAGEVTPPTVTRDVPVGEVATVTLFFSRAEALATREEVLNGFLLLAAFGLLLSIGAGFVVSSRVTRPVEALTDAAARIAGGEPGVRVDTATSTSELKNLVTTFNTMTDDLKVATDRLVASERIAAWQEVARRLAHEIKNPLTPIRMSLETLLAASQRGQLDDRFQALFAESAKAVLEEVDRLKRIVDEFSQFARLPKPELQPLNLADTAAQVLSLYAPHGTLTYAQDLQPAQAKGDKNLLTQVLVNLVKNAEEAMGERGGCVTVRTREVNGDAFFEVLDQGPGIPAELKARIFEPYVTTKPQGSGLGLAIAARIAQEHGGRLEVDDAPGGGACFRLVLPRLS